MSCVIDVVYSTSELFLIIPIITLLIAVLQIKSDRPLLDEPLHLGLEGGGQDPHQGLGGKPGIKSINNELLVVVGVVVVI